MQTLIILNPYSGGGRAGRIFHTLDEKLVRVLGDYLVAITHDVDALDRHIDFAASSGIRRIIALGGDGTNYAILNALAHRPELEIEFGTIPMGTGRDWARSLGIPVDPHAADAWIAHVRPTPCDLGRVDYLDAARGDRPTSRLFLNVASTGISRDVIARVNRAKRRTATCFLTSTIRSLIGYKPRRISVECDGTLFYEGPSYLLAVANGRSFGRGMRIAPNAILDDGKFEVVIVEGMPRWKALTALPSLYAGTHLRRSDVHATSAREVTIRSEAGSIDLDLDGEEAVGTEVRFSIQPRAITMLLDPTKAAVQPSAEK